MSCCSVVRVISKVLLPSQSRARATGWQSWVDCDVGRVVCLQTAVSAARTTVSPQPTSSPQSLCPQMDRTRPICNTENKMMLSFCLH